MTTWRSACGNATCVEVAFVSACDTSSCVEVGTDGDRVLVRNSTRPEPVVEFTAVEWAEFLAGVRRGEFDRA